MGGPFDRLSALGELPPSHRDKMRFLPKADRSVIDTIRVGVLFVMAFWSGSARAAFVRLKRVLSDIDPGGQLEVVVVDTDGCSDLYECPEFAGRLHGNGEAAWIAGGRIVCTATGGSHPLAFEAFARHLLDESDRVTFDSSWRTSTVVALAQGIYAERALDRLPILADALQDAGCDNADILTHLRGDGPHVRGCWALDLILGKQ